MKIDAKTLINKFYDEVCREKYPRYTEKQIYTVCHAPFAFIRKAISNGVMPTIRFKYFGEMAPNAFKAVEFLRHFERIKKGTKDLEYNLWWLEVMKRNAQRVVDKAICETYDLYLNEKGLITKAIDEKELKRLLKIYTSHDKTKADNIEECDSILSGESEI